MDELYIYAILKAPVDGMDGTLSALGGVTLGAPRTLDLAGHTVVAGSHDGSEILQTRRRMLAHTKVLEAAMALAPLLPMRFGHVVRGTDALEGLIAAHGDAIDATFGRLRDDVEVGLRISFPRAAALDALLESDSVLKHARNRLSGRGADAHFERIELGRAVAEQLDRRRGVAQRALVKAIAPSCSAYVLKAPEEDVEILRLECLVEPAQIEHIAGIAEDAARSTRFADADPQVKVVGPVPPYHFVDLSLTTTESATWA